MTNSSFDAKTHLLRQKRLIDRELKSLLPSPRRRPQKIHKALHYAVFSGGKRIRAILALEANHLFGGRIGQVMNHACAIELLHNYSLIHDDLPSMDNDDTRRGKPTVHKKFDKQTALLAGDALLTLSFGVIAKDINASVAGEVGRVLAEAAGSSGMIGGQAMDIEYAKKKASARTLKEIHLNKTAKLIAASLSIGAITAGAKKLDQQLINHFGELMGTVFQLVDDVLDGDGFCHLYGPGETLKYARKLTRKAHGIIEPYGPRAKRLLRIADFIVNRKN